MSYYTAQTPLTYCENIKEMLFELKKNYNFLLVHFSINDILDMEIPFKNCLRYVTISGKSYHTRDNTYHKIFLTSIVYPSTLYLLKHHSSLITY